MTVSLPRARRPSQIHSIGSGSMSAAQRMMRPALPACMWLVACAASSSRSLLSVPPPAIQSKASPLSGSSGRRSTLTLAATPASEFATSAPCFSPTSSLSGKITTSAPARCLEKSSRHLPAPCGLHVAATPALARASTAFSPSQMKIGLLAATASIISGRRYRTRRVSPKDHIQPPLPSGRRCRKSFGAERTT